MAMKLSLRKRIKLIIEPFKTHLGTSDNRLKLVRNIVDTRNYFTHFNEKLETKAAKNKDLLKLCNKMEVIFKLLLLKEVGFTDEEINNIVKENSLLNGQWQ